MIENPSVQAGASFKFVDWEPEAETRSACCGDLCEPCTGDDTSWWCEGAPVRCSYHKRI